MKRAVALTALLVLVLALTSCQRQKELTEYIRPGEVADGFSYFDYKVPQGRTCTLYAEHWQGETQTQREVLATFSQGEGTVAIQVQPLVDCTSPLLDPSGFFSRNPETQLLRAVWTQD